MNTNSLGAAIGKLIGGYLTDRYGRIIFNYDLLIYMFGAALIAASINFPMLLFGTIIIGMAVGAGVPVAWTYISEEAPKEKRASRVGATQLAWSIGPALTFVLATLAAPLGLLGSRLIFLHLLIIAFFIWYLRRGLPESKIWEEQKRQEQKEKTKGIIQKNALKELFTLKPIVKHLSFYLAFIYFGI